MANYRGDTYGTWQEASDAVFILEICKQGQYNKEYLKDPFLPSSPSSYYKDFPGWRKFLKIDFYPTWQEANVEIKKLGIKDRDDYLIRYKKLDKRLHSNPSVFYKDFPGWKKYIGNEFYATWTESLQSAINMGITNWKQYSEMYDLDPRLRSRPQDHYSDFIWDIRQFVMNLYLIKYCDAPLLELERI